MLTGDEVKAVLGRRCQTCGAKRGEPCGGRKAGLPPVEWGAFHMPRQDAAVWALRRAREEADWN